MRTLKITGAVVSCLIAIVIVLLVTGIPSSFITSLVQDRIARDTGYRIAIAGKTAIEIWPSFGLTLHNVTLENPKDGTKKDGATDLHLTVGEVRADLLLSSLLSGSPKVSELTIDHPTLRLPMLRERTRTTAPAQADRANEAPADTTAFPVDRVTISNGAIVFFDPDNRLENRINDLDATVTFGADRKIDIAGSARPGTQSLKFTIKAAPPAGTLGRQNIPTELTLDAPGVLTHQLTAKADVRINDQVLLINGLSGSLNDGKFNGWATVDLASKPLVKVDLDFQRLGFGPAPGQPGTNLPTQSGTQPWSDVPFDLNGLNYVDAQVTLSAAELRFGDARFAPASVKAIIADGVLQTTFSRLGAYDGEANGALSVDASKGQPTFALKADITGVRAMPLLSSLADFDTVDGKMQAKADVQATGNSLRAIMSSVSGTASVDVRDGALRNLNLAKMIRALTSGTLSGWQERPDQTTDLSQLTTTATIAQGKATTNDLFLAGPLVRMTGAGTVDLGSKTLAFRVEPKLVMTTEGQGGSADPIGLGIPVIVQGSWSEPRIYPDVAGILDNPDAAYAKLRELGQGLFGQGGIGSSGKSGLGETLGTLIQQGLGGGAGKPAPGGQPAPGQPSQGQAPQGGASPLDDIMKRLFGR
jgi:AsmA protein